MKYQQIAPFISLCLNLVSLTGCALAADYRKAIYWFGAAIITASLTF